jgi:hypothetical protein
VFEGNIRVGGGLLSAYALTGDDVQHVHQLIESIYIGSKTTICM